MSVREKIAQLRAEADALEKKLLEFENMPEDEKMAITLHKLLCHWNHTDGCSWEYESSGNKTDWNGHAHGRYLTKARTILTSCKNLNIKSEDAINILKLAQE